MLRIFLLASAILLSFPNSGAADSTQPTAPASAVGVKSLRVKLMISAEGKIERMDWVSAETVSDQLSDYLTPLIRKIEFEPAILNGKAAQSELVMNAILTSTPAGEGKSQVEFLALEKTVASVSKMEAPQFPKSTLTQGISAYLIVAVQIRADGTTIENSITLESLPNVKNAQLIRQFFREAKRVLSGAQFELTEKVAGNAVGGMVRIPFIFCAENCDAINKEVEKFRSEQTLTPTAASGISLARVKPAREPVGG